KVDHIAQAVRVFAFRPGLRAVDQDVNVRALEVQRAVENGRSLLLPLYGGDDQGAGDLGIHERNGVLRKHLAKGGGVVGNRVRHGEGAAPAIDIATDNGPVELHLALRLKAVGEVDISADFDAG